MSSAKNEILERIRSAQKLSGTPKSVEVPRNYRRASEHSAAELKELLIDRLNDYKAHVIEATEDSLGDALRDILTERSCRDVRFAPGLDSSLFKAFVATGGVATPDDVAKDPRELDHADAVVTDSHVSCAQTGTIVLESNNTNGRRALTLVPDRHVCIVRMDTVVFGVPEMISRINPERPATMISGPSATSDIELNRVEGVHGPRDLIVIVVS